MGIFTGSEMLFFFLGSLTTLLVGGLLYLQRIYDVRWFGNILAGTGIFLLVFTIAWSVSSVLEGEPQAANMGLLIFGMPALLLMALSRRFMRRRIVAS
jgi:hypothetical protein